MSQGDGCVCWCLDISFPNSVSYETSCTFFEFISHSMHPLAIPMLVIACGLHMRFREQSALEGFESRYHVLVP
jgi:hypothetical protein